MPATDLAHHYHYAGAFLLFCLGLYSVIAQPNIIKKILGLNIMETSVFFLMVSLGYVEDGVVPLAAEGVEAARMVNPVPQALILTGIVVAVGTTAIALALATMIHRKYGTFDVDGILREGAEGGEGR